jgi:hypothetical protein
MDFDFSMLTDEEFAKAQAAMWDEGFRRMGMSPDTPGKHEAKDEDSNE